MKTIRTYGLAAVALCATFALARTASAATLVVDDDGMAVSGDCDASAAAFTTVQAAITAAAAGDTIEVCPGTYNENVTVNKANLTLLGAKAGIAAGPSATPAGRGTGESIIQAASGNTIFFTGASGVRIDGFTVVAASSAGGSAIYASGADNVLVNNVLRGDGGTATGFASGVRTGSMSNIVVQANNIDGLRYGMNLDGSPANAPGLIADNYVTGNPVTGMILNSTSPNGQTITGNLIEGNGSGMVVAQGEHLIKDNVIRNNGGSGIYVFATARTFGISILDNELRDNGSVAVYFASDDPAATGNEVHGNNIVGNGFGVYSQNSATIDATCNWWGDASGPSNEGPGTGDSVYPNITYEPWLTAPAPGGQCNGPLSSMQMKQGVRDALAALLPTGDGQDDHRIEKAIDRIDDSLDPSLWVDGEHLDAKHGKKVFDRERQAVQELGKVDNTDVSVQIGQLVDIDRKLAQTAIDDAVATPIVDPKNANKVAKDLDNAYDELADGDSSATAGDPPKAVEHYRKAWENAQKAIEDANK
ncbi:MAG: hypothetical protein KC543_00770 [Myxococcales bacterium]|nr:hypothetical protein [Myxococcales bacterium]